MKNEFKKIKTTYYLIIMLQFSLIVFAQDKMETQYNRDTLITTARTMMEAVRYCALITLDSIGHPDARIMDPFLPDDNMVIWLGTNINSRKVKQIENDSRVTLYYQAPNEAGYVVIKGQAYIVQDSLKKQTYWKKEWSRFYAENKSNYILIKVIPEKLEVIDYQHGIFGDSKTWDVPFVKFQPGKSN
jgi:general stress protein 26